MKIKILIWGVLFAYSLHGAEQQAEVINIYNRFMQEPCKTVDFLYHTDPLVLARSLMMVDETGKNVFCSAMTQRSCACHNLFFDRIDRYDDETKKAILCQKDMDGNNALMLAIMNKYYNVANKIFDAMYWLSIRSPDPVHFLLEQNHKGYNGLTLSVLCGQHYVTEHILRNVKHDVVLLRQLMEQVNSDGNNIAMRACINGGDITCFRIIEALKVLDSVRLICDQRNQAGYTLIQILESRGSHQAKRLRELYKKSKVVQPVVIFQEGAMDDRLPQPHKSRTRRGGMNKRWLRFTEARLGDASLFVAPGAAFVPPVRQFQAPERAMQLVRSEQMGARRAHNPYFPVLAEGDSFNCGYFEAV